MSNQFSGRGNVGGAPALRKLTVDGEPRSVVEMRVYFDRRVPVAGGQFEDRGGFWLTVSLWGAMAEIVAGLLQKGARVYVEGSLRQESWKDSNTQEDRTEFRLTAEHIALDLMCLESVVYRKRSGRPLPGGESDEYAPF